MKGGFEIHFQLMNYKQDFTKYKQRKGEMKMKMKSAQTLL